MENLRPIPEHCSYGLNIEGKRKLECDFMQPKLLSGSKWGK
jgi:hypothetical protein